MGTALVRVKIRNLAFGGAGVGEVQEQYDGLRDLLGITAFVPFTIPGEMVKAEIRERSKNFVKAELTEIEEPSPDRVQPECRYFGTCGGCELQHISYTAQLKAKYEMIRGALASGKLSTEVIGVLEPLEPSAPYTYRRRVSLHLDPNGKLGFYREGSRAVVAIDECPISVEEIEKTLRLIPDACRDLRGKISSIALEADAHGVIGVIKAPYALASDEQKFITEKIRPVLKDVVLMEMSGEVGGTGRQILELPLNASETLSLRVPASYFSQVNWEINLKLIEAVLNAAEVKRGMHAVDLYAGAGNFTLPLARAGAKVTAVECDKRLVAFGRQNASRYNLDRAINFIDSSVEKYLSKPGKAGLPDCIIADPPRSGLGSLAAQLPKAPRFILISCHLASFVRDLRALIAAGYDVQTIKPFDMFPQTSYVEIMAVLRA